MTKPFSKFLKNYKHTHKCIICGEDADCCLEFHHINSKDKLFSLRSVNEHKYSKQELISELNKCCLLCCNCHRKLHNDLLSDTYSLKWLYQHKINIKPYD